MPTNAFTKMLLRNGALALCQLPQQRKTRKTTTRNSFVFKDILQYMRMLSATGISIDDETIIELKKKSLLCIIVHHHFIFSAAYAFVCRLMRMQSTVLISPHRRFFFCSIVASKNKLRQSDSVNNKGMQRQLFCFQMKVKIIYISTMVKKGKKKVLRDVFELCYNIIQYQYVLRLQKLCYYSECVSDHSYSNVL